METHHIKNKEISEKLRRFFSKTGVNVSVKPAQILLERNRRFYDVTNFQFLKLEEEKNE